MSVGITVLGDYTAMIEAADQWGPGVDENRRWFLGGWIDYCDNERGRAAPDPDDEAAMCGYNSGWIAARSKYDPTPEERASQFRDAVIETLQ